MSSEKKDNREKRNDEGTDGKKAGNRMKAETDEFILRNVFYFLYAPTSVDRKACLFFNPNHLIPSAYIKLQQKFLDAHFAGYLSEEKSEKRENGYKFTRICGVDMRKDSDIGDLTNTRLDLFGGQKNKRGKGPEVKCAFLEKIQADDDHDQGFSRVVSDMEKQNYEVLKSWNLDMDVCITKLEKFIERMRNGEKSADSKLREMPAILKREILDLVEQQVQKRSWESMATAITWLLIASLLRGDTGILQPYYRKMGENREPSAMPEPSSASDFSSDIRNSPPPEPVPIHFLYSNPDEIRPYTMEDIGNLRNTYVQRTAALEQIYDKMHSGQVYGKRYVYISGIGGCGKTELARAYAYTYREEYDEIFWFTCDEEEMPGVEKLLADSIYGETVTADILSQMDERCLLILDNCNSISSGAIRELHQKTGKAHLLVTTRLAVITQIRPEQMLYLNESQQDNCNFAFQVFCANYFAETDIWGSWGGAEETAGKKEFSKEEKADIESICRFVWYHPMAVAIIAVMLRENGEEETIESFAGKCRLGLNQAFPMGERIPFGQGAQDYDEEPLEILKELFVRFPRRPFTTRERQVLKILQLFPARQMDIEILCGLLGDSSMDKSVKNDCRTLSSLQWIQSNGVWVTMHPLISQVLEIAPDRLSFEDETEFYRPILEKWMISENRDINSGKDMFFVYQLWKKSGVSEGKNAFNLAVSLLMDKRNATALFEELYPEVTFAFTAIVREQGSIHFVYYDLMRREEVVFYQIRGTEERQSVTEKCKSHESAVTEEEWVNLVFLRCRETEVRLDFPDCILGHAIEEIPESFCLLSKGITGLKLPGKLKRIGNKAFKECVNIEGELVLPETLQSIGKDAFAKCTNLRGNLVIPGGVEIIEDGAFDSCGIDGTLRICKGVVIIGEGAFLDCKKLTKVILEEGLIEIGVGAFFDCVKMKKLVIPKTVQHIGEYAFANCSKWKGNLQLPSELNYLGEAAFAFCKNLSGEIRIPYGIHNIPKRIFFNCKKLKIHKDTFHEQIICIGSYSFSRCGCQDGCLELPEKIEVIQAEAFSNCISIRQIRFGKKLRIIEEKAFANCWGLKEISEFPDTLEKIGNEAFKNCFFLKSNLKLSNHLESIGKKAFANCLSLKGGLDFPESVKDIGSFAFFNCRGLKGSLSFHEGLNSIGHCAFGNCSSLTEISKLPESLECVYSDSFKGCKKLTGLEIVNPILLEKKYCVTEEGELLVPDGMEELTKEWIEDRRNILPERIIIPEQIKKIGEEAFCIPSRIKEIVLPSNLEVIGQSAFAFSMSLENIVLPESLQTIDNFAFQNCKMLGGELTFPPQIKYIGEKAFFRCDNLEKVILPRHLKSIGDKAFMSCFCLKEVKMFEGLSEIRFGTFAKCCCLKKIEFPEGLEIIGEHAFSYCNRLEKIQLPEGLKRIGECAFYSDMGLSGNLILPESLEIIECHAFRGCFSLSGGDLIIPENVKKVGEYAFGDCYFSNIIIKNPNMELGNMFESRIEGKSIIWGYEDSTAFAYALKYGCPFRDIREWPGFDSQDTSMSLR